MEKIQEKIEFYKPRGFADRLVVTFKFIRMNFKVILKNTALFVVPIAMIQSYFMKDYLNMAFNPTDDYMEILTSYGVVMLLFGLVSVLIYSLTASMMIAYEDGSLQKNTGITQLKNFPRFIVKTAGLVFLLGISIGLVAFLLALISPFLIILLLFGMIAVIPSIALVFYPAYYEGLNVWDSFVKGFRMGFKNWGTTFLMLMLLGIILGVVQYVLFIPYYIWIFAKLLLSQGNTQWYDSWITYVVTLIAYLGSYMTMPAMIIGMSFQYFGIREKDEHISVQSQLDQFENL